MLRSVFVSVVALTLVGFAVVLWSHVTGLDVTTALAAVVVCLGAGAGFASGVSCV